MALYWPEARLALDLMEGHDEAPGEKYPPDVLVISVREEQVVDPEFLEEMRELIVRRTERFADEGDKTGARKETVGSERRRPRVETGIPSINDIFEGLVSDDADNCDLDDSCFEDCLGNALEIGYGLAAGSAPQVQLVINGCRDVIVRPGEVGA